MSEYEKMLVNLGSVDLKSNEKMVGGFAIEDIKAINENHDLGINNVNLITVEDWDWKGLNDIAKLMAEDVDILDVIILNLNKVDSAEDSNFEGKVETFLIDNGFKDITKHIGYDTRLCIINTNKAIGEELYINVDFDIN